MDLLAAKFNYDDILHLVVKGTVNVNLSHPTHSKMTMPDSQRYPWNLYLIDNVEDIVVFLDLKCFVSGIDIFK